jgi:hypothetical protein
MCGDPGAAQVFSALEARNRSLYEAGLQRLVSRFNPYLGIAHRNFATQDRNWISKMGRDPANLCDSEQL